MSESDANPEPSKGDKSSSKKEEEEKTLVFKNPATITILIKKGDQPSASGNEEKPDNQDDSKSSGEDDSDKKDSKAAKDKPHGTPIYKKRTFIIIICAAAVVIVIAVILLWLVVRQYVSTDDAYIDGHVVQVSPQVGARVLALHIEDNEFVHKGDLLIRLDPTDYQVALQQAKANISAAAGRLEQARAQIGSAKAAVLQALAQKNAAQASLDNATKDLERYQQVDERARSKQQLDNASTAQINDSAQLEETEAQVTSAQASVATAEAAAKAADGELQTAQADERRAEVNLSYCDIFAPNDGRITERTVEAGNYVTPGQALCLLVDPNVWVTANFKETQLTHMQPGQPVTIKVDAFAEHKFRGHVDSIQAGSGSRFSVLPAENATGNYVKVVQRVPVKIVFEHAANTNNAFMLSPGLSVIPRVKVQ